jgi:hypothetical protein
MRNIKKVFIGYFGLSAVRAVLLFGIVIGGKGFVMY